jgi:hypothetical protein
MLGALLSFLNAFFAERYINPTGKSVAQIPTGFSMADENEYSHILR